MTLLVISLIALALGPLLFRVADRARWALSALDGFVMVTIAGLIVVHIIPHALAAAGPGALILALFGFLGPALVERLLERAAQKAHAATLVLALIGLLAHAVFDGVALAASGHGHAAPALAVAVALHRLPIGVTVWWLIPDRRLAGSILAGLAAGTLAGYHAGGGALEAAVAEDAWIGLVQALVGGSLLHVVLHRPSPFAGTTPRSFAGLGALAGLLPVALLSDTHLPLQAQPGTVQFGSALWTLARESAPALVVAFALAGVVQAALPRARIAWIRGGGDASRALRGAVFGLPLPICSCGVIPLYRSLVLRGVPATAAMSFLVATPELGLDAVLISLPLLGPHLTLARVACAALAALAIGYGIGRLVPPAVPSGDADDPAPDGWLARLRAGLHHGLVDTVDHVGPWLLLGLAIAALVEPMLGGGWLAGLPPLVAVILFAVLGMPTYVCASAATPLVAVLIHKGVSPGAAIAFLLAGPATNVTTFGVLTELHGRRVAIGFGAGVLALAISLGWVVGEVLPHADVLSLHRAAGEPGGLLELAALTALAALLALSLVRQGPRGFLGQILSPYGRHRHDH